MAGYPKALDAEVVPACTSFLRALMAVRGNPNRLAEEIVQRRRVTAATSPKRNRANTVATWLRGFCSLHDPTYPQARTVWDLAEPMRAIGHRWCAGPVMLFAAGHFEEFVYVVAFAGRKIGRLDERLENIEATIAKASLRAELHQNAAARRRGENVESLSKDYTEKGRSLQKSWTLSAEETALFENAWHRLNRGEILPDDASLDTALLVARAYSGKLATRRYAILHHLRTWLNGR